MFCVAMILRQGVANACTCAQNLAKTEEIELVHQIWWRSGALVSGAFRPEPFQNRGKSIGFYSVQERFGVPLWGR